jgi:GDP-4-dehydro-6-deoxy-D-mannose reductase
VRRALITGASGFAGTWLCRECAAAGDAVIALSRRGTAPEGCGPGLAVDLCEREAVAEALRSAAPDVVYHLAALSSVGRSWRAPGQTLGENVGAAVNLLEAVRLHAPQARVVWVSSCEVYGEPVSLPIPESAPVAPANPYAVSKAAGEQLCDVYAAAYGLEIVRARPFSHSGPGQRPIFLLSSLARQAAEGRRLRASRLRILTGNADTRRDFTDVRDIVRAYRLLGEGAGDPGGGGVFNVSSGRSVSAAEQVALLGELIAPIEIEHVVDSAQVRPHEVMDLRGDHARLTAATGWRPEIPFAQTMADTVAWWESELARAA